MVTDHHAMRLWSLMKSEKTQANAAEKADMDEKAARKYCDLGRLPSEVKAEYTWPTPPDPLRRAPPPAFWLHDPQQP